MNLLEQVMIENLRAQQERNESYLRRRENQDDRYFVWGCFIASITISLLSLLS